MVAAGSITVAVRVRPPTAWEAARLPEPCYDTTIRGDGALSAPRSVATTSSLRDIVQIVDDRILTFDPDEKDKARAFVERGFMPPGTKRYKDRRFMFDRVFNHEARQQDVYEATSQPLLKGLFDGFNATVFAYGATGCGKTHTISGTEADPGIIYLTMADLFQRIEDRKDEWNVEVMVTFLEIYNEEIRDLLCEPGSQPPRGGLSIREDKAVKVVGLVELRPQSADEVKEIVLLGNTRRTQSPTHANETSSRSHAVLQIHLTQSPRTASITEERTMATLSIIDLAGSERAAATTNMGQRMVEGANINKSLLALGNCINALCESGGAIRHIPYRNSKLTRLLKFSLGGNCKTVMIVCVAPTSNHFDDTHNTLVYAERATKIKTKVITRNVVNVDRHVGQYVEAINRLNSEIAELKAKLAGKHNAEGEIARRRKAEANAEVERAKKDMLAKTEHTRVSIVDGATCAGKLTVANAKLRAIRARLSQIEAIASSNSGTLSSDLEAERGLLKALADPEEKAVRPDSALTIRLNRSSNSNAMFDATLRAVSERKSEKLDEVSVDNVKLDAKYKKAEMERVKAEGERDVLKGAVADMADVMVQLVSMLGRCTVVVGEAGKVLGGSLNGNPSNDTESAVKRVAGLLGNMKQKNDEVFVKLVGHSTEGYTLDNSTLPTSSWDDFQGFATTFTRRGSSGSVVLHHANSSKLSSNSRRSSAYDSNDASLSPPRRAYRSPRKSLRSSMASQPYRRVSDKEKKGHKNVKTVQWKDKAGQGDLDDGGARFNAPTVIAVIPLEEAGTSSNNSSMFSSSVAMTSAAASASTSRGMPQRTQSLGGSESEWEDDNEKTDDSLSLSFMSSSLSASARDQTQPSVAPSRAKRPRASRLDPSFLKSKSRGSALGSLAEGDESGSPERRGSCPLSDMSVNRLSTDAEGNHHDSHSLHVPKGHHGRHGVHGSPARRGPATPRAGGTGMSSGRRKSNIGPMRNEKGRRRSSMIPQLSPPNADGNKSGPRRVMIASPAKRTKRTSLAGSRSLISMSVSRSKSSSMIGSSSIANLSMSVSMDPNASADMSFNKSSRPTWR